MVVKFFTNITLQLMKNFLHFDLMQKVKNCLTNDNPLEGRYETQQTAFLTSFRRLDEAMLISRKSILTPEIQKLDSQRVAEWRIIKTAAKESLKMSPAEKADAAEFVLSIINNHGDIQEMKVTERTGALSNLCQDLNGTYSAQVEAIGLQGFAAQLTATNAEYLRLYEERLHQWSEYTNDEVKAAREEIDDRFENLLIMVASGIITQGMEPFKHFVDYINEVIKQAKIAMGASTSGGASGGETGGSEDSEDSENSENSEDSEGSEETIIPPSEGITLKFRDIDNKILYETVVPIDYQIPESEFPAPPEGTHWNFTLADLNLAIGMKNPGDTITVRAQAND